MEDATHINEVVHLNSTFAASAPGQTIEQINALLAKNALLVFPTHLEASFQAEMSAAKARRFALAGVSGLAVYNSFLFTDRMMMPDIFTQILIVQLAIVSPIILATLYLIHRRIVKPELSTTLCLILIFGSVVAFYAQSRTNEAAFLIFTVPSCLAFGNVVLPLPFRMSVLFTLFCIGMSTIAVIYRPGYDLTLCSFAICVNASAGLYMLFGTYRAELSERTAYLFNVREKCRADQLAENNEQLRNLSETDALTHVSSRRYFDVTFDRLWRSAMQNASPVALHLIDIDHFKKLNDTYGHQAGDQCLRAVAQCLQQHLMPNAILARYGGEEFVVLLPNVNDIYACASAEVLRAAIERLEVVLIESQPPVSITISIGVAAAIPTADGSSLMLLQAADRALYSAKANGRNRVEKAARFIDTGVSELRQTA